MATLLIPITWSMIAGACLAIGAINLAAWMRLRKQAAFLAFGVLALSVTCLALFELALMRAETPEEYGQIQRWMHLAVFATLVSMVAFVRTYFDAGRPWLAWTICSLRLVVVVLNFVFDPNIEYSQIVAVGKMSVAGEPVSVALGVQNRWIVIGEIAVYLFYVFIIDASVTVWRRRGPGDRRRAAVVGGSLLATLLIAGINTRLMHAGVISSVYLYAVPFTFLLAAIASQISADLAATAELADRLVESQEELERSRRRMAQATASAGIGIWEWEIERDRIWMNDKGREVFGFLPAEPIDFGRFDASLHPEDREAVRAAVESSRMSGGSFERQYRIQGSDRGTRWIHTLGAVERDAEGHARLMRGVFFDVTARRESDELFRMVVEAAANGLLMLDHAGRITLVNASAEAMFGYSRAQLRGQGLEMLVPAGAALSAPVGRVEAAGRHRDGRVLDLELAATAIRTSQGEETLVSIVDISERKRRDEQLRRERAFLRQVIDIAPNLIFAKDRRGRFTLANEAVAQIYGTSVEDMIGRTDSDFNSNRAEVEAFRQADVEVMDSRRERFIAEEHVTDAAGEAHVLQTVKRPIVGDDGTADQVLGVSTDITARKEAERELERQRNQLAHLSRVTMVSELSGSIAHELNQPLTAILGNAEAALVLMRQAQPPLEELRAILDDIVRDDLRAANVIAGMRALLRKGELRREPLDMAALVEAVLRLVHSDLLDAGVCVRCDFPARLPTVSGDRVQLQQVVLNLVMNGCDAMAANGPRERELAIAISVVGSGLRVAVTDRGPGIAAEQLDRAFEPFFTTKKHGLGLGLAICRNIIGAHGGSLAATPNATAGMTFAFVLPLGAP